MAELADAYGSGPYECKFMQVQVLLSAPVESLARKSRSGFLLYYGFALAFMTGIFFVNASQTESGRNSRSDSFSFCLNEDGACSGAFCSVKQTYGKQVAYRRFLFLNFYGPHFLWGSSSSAFPGGRLHHQICASPLRGAFFFCVCACAGISFVVQLRKSISAVCIRALLFCIV